MTSEEQEQALKHLGSWGRQTIAFAMSLHALAIGKSRNDPAWAQSGIVEATRIATDLWAIAHAECAQPVQLQDITNRFTRKVLDWATEHRKGDLP